jgi:hypothetical protein
MVDNVPIMYIKMLKEPIQETNCDEWLGTYDNLITCLVAIFYTPKHFRPNIMTLIPNMVILRMTPLYMISNHVYTILTYVRSKGMF